MISVGAFMCGELVGAALLALWVLARFPRLGPTSLRSALVAVGATLAVLRLSSFSDGLLMRLPHGAYVTLFGWVLPSFFAAFLTTGWLLRIFAGALGGSGGGTGHLASAHSRR